MKTKVTAGYRCKCRKCDRNFITEKEKLIFFGVSSSSYVQCPNCEKIQDVNIGLVHGNVHILWKVK